MSKKFLSYSLLFIFSLILFTTNAYSAASQTPVSYKDTVVLEIVKNPKKYLNHNIQFTGKFDKFTILGLDYNGALRSSEKYVGFTIQRDDIKDHNIPLSEMKLFLKQEVAQHVADLDTGDVIKIQGKVFSIALNDPWVDVDKITIIKKAKETK